MLAPFNLSPSQLNTNAYKILAGMHILWRQLFKDYLTVEEVYYLFKPSSTKSEVGYIFLALWEKKKIMMANLSSTCDGWKEKNLRVGGNFDPFSSVAGAQPVPRNYNVPDKCKLRKFLFFFAIPS